MLVGDKGPIGFADAGPDLVVDPEIARASTPLTVLNAEPVSPIKKIPGKLVR